MGWYAVIQIYTYQYHDPLDCQPRGSCQDAEFESDAIPYSQPLKLILHHGCIVIAFLTRNARQAVALMNAWSRIILALASRLKTTLHKSIIPFRIITLCLRWRVVSCVRDRETDHICLRIAELVLTSHMILLWRFLIRICTWYTRALPITWCSAR